MYALTLQPPRFLKRRGYLVSMGEDLGAIKISGWTHVIPQYFDFDNFWGEYPGAKGKGGVAVPVPAGEWQDPGLPRDRYIRPRRPCA